MRDIAEHILDIAQNSIAAHACKIEIKLHQSVPENYYQLSIIDDGSGMSSETLQKVIDPFYTSRTTRKVGMGIPLLKQNTEITGGKLVIHSKLGEGTLVQATFVFDSIDRVPEGDLAGTIVLLAASNPNVQILFEYATGRGNYIFDTMEVRNVLGDIPLVTNEIRKYLIELIFENIAELQIP